jgi:hypothetical protein
MKTWVTVRRVQLRELHRVRELCHVAFSADGRAPERSLAAGEGALYAGGLPPSGLTTPVISNVLQNRVFEF